MSSDSDRNRDRRQKIVDRLLTLYLSDRVSEQSRITGDVKLQKLVFLSEKSMIEDDVSGLNYKFFRWNHGPMSKGVYNDYEFLCERRLVSEQSGTILNEGQEVLREAAPLLNENRNILNHIDRVVNNYGDLPGYKLKSLVYDKKVEIMESGEERLVEHIPEGWDIFWSLPPEMAETTFNVSDSWIETLGILLDSEARSSVNQAVEEAKENESKPFEIQHV